MKATRLDPVVGHREVGGQVHSALLRACLPESDHDQGRRLAWVGAIAAVVLATGVLGRRAPGEWVIPPLADDAPMFIPAKVFSPPPDSSPAEQPESAASSISGDAPMERPVVPPSPDLVVHRPDPIPLFGGPTSSGSRGTVQPVPAWGGGGATRASADGDMEVFRVGGGNPPQGGYFPRPDYPREARLRREQGEVQLLVEVDEGGHPTRVEVRVPSGSPLLDRETMNHVRRHWRWPAGAQRRYLVPWEWKLR